MHPRVRIDALRLTSFSPEFRETSLDRKGERREAGLFWGSFDPKMESELVKERGDCLYLIDESSIRTDVLVTASLDSFLHILQPSS